MIKVGKFTKGHHFKTLLSVLGSLDFGFLTKWSFHHLYLVIDKEWWPKTFPDLYATIFAPTLATTRIQLVHCEVFPCVGVGGLPATALPFHFLSIWGYGPVKQIWAIFSGFPSRTLKTGADFKKRSGRFWTGKKVPDASVSVGNLRVLDANLRFSDGHSGFWGFKMKKGAADPKTFQGTWAFWINHYQSHCPQGGGQGEQPATLVVGATSWTPSHTVGTLQSQHQTISHAKDTACTAAWDLWWSQPGHFNCSTNSGTRRISCLFCIQPNSPQLKPHLFSIDPLHKSHLFLGG